MRTEMLTTTSTAIGMHATSSMTDAGSGKKVSSDNATAIRNVLVPVTTDALVTITATTVVRHAGHRRAALHQVDLRHDALHRVALHRLDPHHSASMASEHS